MKKAGYIMTHEYVAGIDIGNGYVKAGINDLVICHPSVAVNRYSIINDIKLGAAEIDDFMKDVFNQMDVSFSSPLIKDTSRRLFGQRALGSGSESGIEQFDVFSRKSKADTDLSGVLILGVLAAQALTDHYSREKNLPSKQVHHDVWLSTALPIAEHTNHHGAYSNKLLNSGQEHLVTFHNFEQPITLSFTFKRVYIANEGEAAQYGLKSAKGPFLDIIEKDAKRRAKNGELDDVTGSDLVQAGNTLGIDIGEGTIDFAVFTNGRFNGDASSSYLRGYGNVLELALDRLVTEFHMTYKSRKELSEFLAKTPSALVRSKYEKVSAVVNEEAAHFAKLVRHEVSKVYARVGANVDVVFVYGGGATPLEATLYPELDQLLREMGEETTPIIYLNSGYSRYLNEHGLVGLAKGLYAHDHKK